MNPPNVELSPGATGTAVQQLQNYLVSQGLMTQAQVNTGYGIYGPQTQQAVQELQSRLGVNYSSGPGIYGPQTMQAAQAKSTGTQSSPTSIPSTSSSSNTTSSSSSSGTSTMSSTSSTSNDTPTAAVTYNPQWSTQFGVSQNQWNAMNATQQATISAAATTLSNNYATTGNSMTVQQALAAAASDPNITNAYASALKIDQATFASTVQNYATQAAQTATSQQMQFYNDRKALAANSAAAGQAYSGFREQAQNQLGTTESGIVASSNATLQQNLQNLTSAFEAKYGSAAVPTAAQGAAIAGSLAAPAEVNVQNAFNSSGLSLGGLLQTPDNSTSTIQGNLVGGITGTQTTAEQNAINTEAGNLVNLGLPISTQTANV